MTSPAKLNYPYGRGQAEYAKVVAAYKAKTRDWGAIKSAAEATLAKDADHLDAHWVLGEALANTDEPEAATEHLVIALAGDWLRWGPTLAQNPALTTYLATPSGKALAELSTRVRAQLAAAVAKGPLVLGRRSTWKTPKVGAASATTRGELYAYDADGKRYLRLTHTDHSLAAVLPSPTGELLLAGFTRAEVPDPIKTSPDVPPLLASSWVRAWSPTDLTDSAKIAWIGKARFVTAGWGAGDQLVVTTAPAAGRWSAGAPTTYVVDRATGKLAKTPAAASAGPRVQLSLDEAIVVGTPTMPAELAPAIATRLAEPLAGAPLAAMAMSPSKARIAYVGATDPCGDADAKPSLYVGDATTGAYKHVLTAASRFGLSWLDDDHLIYEDGSGGLRIYDAAAGKQTGALAERAGLGLATLSPSAAPLCTTDPIMDEDAGFEDEGEGEVPDEALDLGDDLAR
ncbi:MAG: hypothetical protein K8W52_19035 [Deltaproteobacteria bacterium]|nr:hypothetical protein [Deltaproteobacteria bacterium]